MTDPGDSVQNPESIEVGASRSVGTIRYWRAKEAVAKGELILGSQINSLGRLMTSASSLLGWSVTISIALIAAIASAISSRPPIAGNSTVVTIPQLGSLLWPAMAAEALLLFTAICCVCVLWPGKWRPPGHDPAQVLNASYDTELEILEAMAGGYAEAVDENSKGLDRLEKLIRSAWACFVAAPIVGLIIYFYGIT